MKLILLIIGLVLLTGTASAGIYYDSGTITVNSTTSANITQINTSIADASVLNETSSKIWFLNANISVEDTATLFLNDTDCDYLRINFTNNVTHWINVSANVYINSINLSSWNITSDAPAVTPSYLTGTPYRSYFIVFGESANAEIKNSVIHHLGYATYKQNPGGGWEAERVYFKKCGFVFDDTQDNIVENNEFYENMYGIYYIWYGNNETAKGNNVHDNECDGIQLWKNTDHCTIENNTVTDNRRIGIYLQSSNHYNTIKNNHISGSDSHGIRSYAGSSHNIFENNTIESSGWDGIVLSFCLNNTIHNNTFRNNDRYGIEVSTEDNLAMYNHTITNNIIYGNGRYGIMVSSDWHKTAYNNVVTGNVVYNNSWDGIYLNNATNLTLKNNIIENNAEYGIINNTGSTFFNFSYNNVWNNTLGSYSGLSAGTGDISNNSLFADVGNYDFHLKSTAGRWNGTAWITDAVHSPCIDVGNPTSDYSNEPSPNGSRVNMGAYGNTKYASKSSGWSPTTNTTYKDVPETWYENGTRAWITTQPQQSDTVIIEWQVIIE